MELDLSDLGVDVGDLDEFEDEFFAGVAVAHDEYFVVAVSFQFFNLFVEVEVDHGIIILFECKGKFLKENFINASGFRFVGGYIIFLKLKIFNCI